MKCSICGFESWRDLDGLLDHKKYYDENRLVLGEKSGFVVCTFCGFVTHIGDYTSEKRLAEFYRFQCREAVTPQNLAYSNHKLLLHERMIGKVFEAWKREGSLAIRSVLDIGCGDGTFLRSLHDHHGFPLENLQGTEWAVGFAEFARKEYGLNILEKPKGQFDLVCCYHVLEHSGDAKRFMLDLREAVKDGGYLYLSVPNPLPKMWDPSRFATGGDFERRYHPNHIHCFSRTSLENLMAATGFAVSEWNTTLNGLTIIATKEAPTDHIVKESPDEVEKNLKKQREACGHLAVPQTMDPAKAVEVYPLFPEGWLAMAFFKENSRSEVRQKGVLRKALSLMPDEPMLWTQLGFTTLQWAEKRMAKRTMNNEIREGLSYLDKSDALSPLGVDILHRKAVIAYVCEGDVERACRLWKEAIRMSPAKYNEFLQYIGHCRAGLDPMLLGVEKQEQRQETGEIDPKVVHFTALHSMKPLYRATGLE